MQSAPWPARRAWLVVFLVLAGAIAGCGDDDAVPPPGEMAFNPFAGYRSQVYASNSMWLCRPGLEVDNCFADLDATEVLPDGSLRVAPHAPAVEPAFDCFYVYPTVNLSLDPGNDTDFTDVRRKLDPLLSQAARFTRICRVFAPLYRQVTFGTLSTPGTERFVDIAYGDVLDAFKHYMGQFDDGRPVVLLGHSQGAGMLTRLLQEEFDGSRLRERLAVALLVGGGGLHVPRGGVVGGTFRNLPLCRRDTETGCVIAYNSFAADAPPGEDGGLAGGAPPGMETACTNPGALGGGPFRYTGSYFQTFAYQSLFRVNVGPAGIETPFALYRNYFAGECVTGTDGVRYLRIAAQPDPDDRRTPRSLRNPLIEALGLGLHMVDYNLPLDDLIAIVERQARAMDTRRSGRGR